ncbi:MULTISPECIES: amino acid ABC transporter ATP-binding protein [unclassified Rhizobium]|uniref:amino acid ABC transporter ATP-binding protein n=1 Tax=unclassified Rhizobium TaxID=2613769 RepID=UPI0006F8378B|nr:MULTISPECIES: amino acid ABC transporter ATP-binding protein [unclassified Rhizobium]KQV39392.1 glutamine ABC transporter ATP-binding protein [Rhizobium sp. Root1212]KRD35397.1 glutamine ABC transporter ATP-binding protein [Rhizobium sp. Root268]
MANQTVKPKIVERDEIVRVSNLGKSFGTHKVLEGINLTVRSGEVLAIIGPSGSGKSTLLRCLNQLEPQTEGIITLAGITLDAAKPASKKQLNDLRRAAGMVFQSFNLFPHLTVLQNVSLPQQRVLGRTKADADTRSRALLERVGLANKADHYPVRCSGGQQQRIAIARALALDPKIMLFDEPTSALDPELGLEVLAVMKELAEAGMTMIVVTHEMHFAETVSNRVMIMADGRVLEEGPSASVMRDPQTERAKRFLQAVRNR